MKNRLCMMILALLLVCCIFSAAAEEVVLRNDIRFGMTKKEVIEKEGREPDIDSEKGFISYRGVDAEEYPNSIIEYHFNSEGKLEYVYMSLHDDADAKQLEKEYKAMNKKLTGLYGKPLGNKNGKTDELVTEGLQNGFTLQSLAKAAKATFKLLYSEWKVETDGGTVKIDQIYEYEKSKLGQSIKGHVICYAFFAGSAE